MTVLDAIRARERGDLETLLGLLADNDVRIRWAAAQQLGLLGDPAAVEPLIQTLAAADDGLRNSAANALAKLGGTAAIPALLEVAENDPAAGVRVSAVDALATLGDPRGFEMLTTLAIDPSPIYATAARSFRPLYGAALIARTMGTREAEYRRIRLWALKRIRQLNAKEALPRLEAAPFPRSPGLWFSLRRTTRVLRQDTQRGG